MSQLTVFYDGACPLCRREIAFLRRMDKREPVAFEDISPPDAAEYCPLPQKQMLSRFHIRDHEGRLIEGAEAFTTLYAEFPGFSWLRPIGRFAPARWLLNRVYDGFLLIRPQIQKLFRSES